MATGSVPAVTTPEWHLGQQQRSVLALLEYLYDEDALRQPVDDAHPPGMTREQVWPLAAEAERCGYVRIINETQLGGTLTPPLWLTSPGAAYVERVQAARQSRLERSQACRVALLRWMYDVGDAVDTRQLSSAGWGTFYAQVFAPEDVADAAGHLAGLGMIRGETQANGEYFAQLTDKGTTCVEQHEGDIRAYGAAQRTGGTTNTTVIHGSNHGQVAQGNHNQLTQHNGVDADGIAAILREMRQVIASLPQSDDRADLELVVDDIEREVSAPEINQGQVGRRVGALRRLSTRAADSTATAAGGAAFTQLAALVDQLAQAVL